MLGTIDGANSHIAIRVALKCEILMMNIGRYRPHVHRDEHPLGGAGASATTGRWTTSSPTTSIRKVGLKRTGIIRASNRYGRFGVREIIDASRRLEHPVAVEMAYKVGRDDYSLELETDQGRQCRCRDPLGRRRRGGQDPESDAHAWA